MKLKIDIFENEEKTPILSHIFYGKDEKEIQYVVDAHTKTDSFFKASMTTRNFKGIPLRTQYKWS